jgi:hypothetical protein
MPKPRPSSFTRRLRMSVPLVETTTFTAVAVRKRLQRRRARSGLRLHRVYLPEALIYAVLRQRDGLPADAPIPDHKADELIGEIIETYLERMLERGRF